jgi:hypothetical protein
MKALKKLKIALADLSKSPTRSVEMRKPWDPARPPAPSINGLAVTRAWENEASNVRGLSAARRAATIQNTPRALEALTAAGLASRFAEQLLGKTVGIVAKTESIVVIEHEARRWGVPAFVLGL